MENVVTITGIENRNTQKNKEIIKVQSDFLNNIAPDLIKRIYHDLFLYGEVDQEKILADFTQ